MFDTISMKQLEGLLEQNRPMTLLDVRTRDEFLSGHLEDAVNIPLEDLESRYGILSRDKPVVVYCAHGSRSMMAARFLMQQGFRVINTAGGLSAYRGKHYL